MVRLRCVGYLRQGRSLHVLRSKHLLAVFCEGVVVRRSPKRCIVLGDKYLEECRRCLPGETAFPSRARLFMHVWSEDRIHFTSTVPVTFRVKGTYRHKFCIPGITFILFVGGKAATAFDAGALNGSSGALTWLCPWDRRSQDSLHRRSSVGSDRQASAVLDRRASVTLDRPAKTAWTDQRQFRRTPLRQCPSSS